MHLTIIFGSFLIKGTGALLLFLCLKTLADMGMEMKNQVLLEEDTILYEKEKIEP